LERKDQKQKLRQIKIFKFMINASDVLDFNLENNAIFLKPSKESLAMADYRTLKGAIVMVLDQKEFNRILFEAKKYLKEKEDPEDRVFEYEWQDDDPIRSLDKLDRLIEMRKTKVEKHEELKFEIWIKEEQEKLGLEYFGPLRRD